MGQEDTQQSKDKVFEEYSISNKLLNISNSNAIIMHCLPAYRGKEITDEIIDCKQSRIFDQAENRMHAQQALLSYIV